MVGPYRQGAAKAHPEPPKRTPERQALAQAIAQAAEYRKGLDGARSALQAARDIEAGAAAVVEAARAEIAEAQTARTAAIVAAASAGEAPAADTRGREARMAEADAVAELEAARASVAALAAPIEDWEYAATKAEGDVAVAVAAVAKALLPDMLAVTQTAAKNLVTAGRVLRILQSLRHTGHGLVPDEHRALDSDADRLVRGINHQWREVMDLSRGGASDWLRALDALRTDPDAALPSLPQIADLMPGEPNPVFTGVML